MILLQAKIVMADAQENHVQALVSSGRKYERNWVHPMQPKLFGRTGNNEYRACRICLRQMIPHNRTHLLIISVRAFSKINSWLNFHFFIVSHEQKCLTLFYYCLYSMHRYIYTHRCQFQCLTMQLMLMVLKTHFKLSRILQEVF